jgi:hypothetical protein
LVGVDSEGRPPSCGVLRPLVIGGSFFGTSIYSEKSALREGGAFRLRLPVSTEQGGQYDHEGRKARKVDFDFQIDRKHLEECLREIARAPAPIKDAEYL